MMCNVYYAVSGENAFGVYTNYDGVKRISMYIRKFRVKKCQTFLEAFCMARDDYNAYQEEKDFDDMFYGNSTDVKINEVLFRSKIRKRNKEDMS